MRIDHTADNLFALVSDIERYPQFIRWIKSMQVVPVAESGPERTVVGNAKVGFKGFSEKLSTRVESNSDQKTIGVSLIEGPLNRLANEWKFIPVGQATDVEFFVDFEFRNFILRALAAANFELAVNLIMKAFVDEADRRYGKV